MLRQVAEGVLVRESEFIQSNAVVVQGRAGVLLVDPGMTGSEMLAIADDLRDLGQPRRPAERSIGNGGMGLGG